MIDLHSHVLPGIDDGSRDPEMSLAMLSALKDQGVDTVAATPHFYPTEMTPDTFFERRQAAFEALRESTDALPVDLRLGAEVQYFEGIQRLSGLREFCISGTELFLLEMPFTRWDERMLRSVVDLSAGNGLTVVLAHIDRYLSMQPQETWKMLADQGVLMQVNAEFFLNRWTRKKALRLFRSGLVQFVGSDCHDLVKRPPNIASAVDVLEKKLGGEAVVYLDRVESVWLRDPEQAPAAEY